MPSALASLAQRLRDHPNVSEKLRIATAYGPALDVAGGIEVGDDTAAIPDGDGFLLFAAEGMMESFIELDPWFAGYSAIMVNLSDIAAMGGTPTAVVDVLWADAANPMARDIWAGMKAASTAYGVPIVGGHTTRFPVTRTPLLAVAVIGKAQHLITSFDAKPGDTLLMAADLRGSYRGDGTVFWNASVGAPPERLRADLLLLKHIADQQWVTAGKDISNGGLLGTLSMLLATSRCGLLLDLDTLPSPPDVDLQHWLLSFPSYGYVLTAAPENVENVRRVFQERGIACATVGTITEGHELTLSSQGEQCVFAQIAPAMKARPATNP